ncbi:hypothetical protein BC939DRAFT_268038 [Gamsiella multidivaricata]|uniref:uncharacterized protein n=1 Tax=Gamsiella multidivaricata TaxID=101098 RepID=UPI00221F098F|nr:uncharacterized protein BC939DRAFT_268038 [Gamsiella multidivaricata]KAI7819227.1 hypothetical protein BC939DRAFT_268038 [Gamsiella multidivaricata]
MCTHPLAAKARKQHEQSRDHPDRVHPADRHVLPPDPEQLPLQEKIKLYITQYHMPDIHKAMVESIASKAESGATISHYVVRFQIDPIQLLQCCSNLGNQFLGDLDSVMPGFHLVCCQILQQILGEDNVLLGEQVRTTVRVKYLPSVFQECHLPSIASTLRWSREDIAADSSGYSSFFIVSGKVTGISLVEHFIYSQTWRCDNPRCNNQNYLHYTPSAREYRVIKRTEDDLFMETGTNASLLQIDLICSHCNLEMVESVLDRVYMKQQVIVLDCTSATKPEGCFINQITAVLKDDLANTVALGERIGLLGRLSRVFAGQTQESYIHGVQIEVNNILRESGRRSLGLPHSIAEVIGKNMSAWNTSQAIIDMLDGVTPRDIYRKLKLALLLSAVSIAERDDDESNNAQQRRQLRPFVHLLVIKNTHDTIVPALITSIASCKK